MSVQFHPNTAGERFLRIDRYGVVETFIAPGNSSPVTVSNVGGGAEVPKEVVGNNIVFKTLTEGANITLNEGPNTIEISASGAGGGITTITDTGASDASLVKVGTAPTAELRGITAGTGIGVAQGADTVTVSNTTTLASLGGDESLVVSGAAAAYTIKGLTAGSGVTLTPSGTDITIAAPAGATYSIADVSATGDESWIGDGVGPAFTLKKVTGGTGITVASDADQVTITNVGAGTTPTFTAGTGDEPLFDSSPLVTFTPTFKSLSAGAGISLASDANAITITNSGASQVYTLSTGASSTGSSLVLSPSPTANDFRLRGILAGTGIGVAISGQDVVITNLNTTVTLASAGGTSLVTDGTGPTLEILGAAEVGSCINLRNTATTLRFDIRTLASSDSAGASPPTNGADAAIVSGSDATALGPRANAGGSNAWAFGPDANASSSSAGALGSGATASSNGALSLGNNSVASATRAVSCGTQSQATSSDAGAFGVMCRAVGSQAYVMGRNARAGGTNAYFIGDSTDNTYDMNPDANSIVLGRYNSGAVIRYLAADTTYAYLNRIIQDQNYVQLTGSATLTLANITGGTVSVYDTNPNPVVNITMPSLATMQGALDKWGTELPIGKGSEFDLADTIAGTEINFVAVTGWGFAESPTWDGTVGGLATTFTFPSSLISSHKARMKWKKMQANSAGTFVYAAYASLTINV